jgi:hypothetical protein
MPTARVPATASAWRALHVRISGCGPDAQLRVEGPQGKE